MPVNHLFKAFPLLLFLAFPLTADAQTVWNPQIVDSTGNVGQHTSMVIDSTGRIHISYYDVTNASLKYATRSGSSWVTTTLNSGGNTGLYSSIAVDSNNRVHISYTRQSPGPIRGLYYITNASGSWVNTPVHIAATRQYTFITWPSGWFFRCTV